MDLNSIHLIKEHRFYKSNDDAIATVIENTDLSSQHVASKHKYRVVSIITVLN